MKFSWTMVGMAAVAGGLAAGHARAQAFDGFQAGRSQGNGTVFHLKITGGRANQVVQVNWTQGVVTESKGILLDRNGQYNNAQEQFINTAQPGPDVLVLKKASRPVSTCRGQWVSGFAPLSRFPDPPIVPAGDWIVSDISTSAGGLFSIGASTGSVSTIAIGRPAGFFNWVVMAGNNRDYAACYSTAGRFAVVTPAGAITSGFAYPSSQNGIDLDQDGSYVTTTSGGSGLYRVTPDGMFGSLLLTAPATLNNVCIDHDTGDYVLAISTALPNGGLLRVNRTTMALSTIAWGLGQVSSVDHCQRDGSFYCTRFNGPEVLEVTPSGVVISVSGGAIYGANAVKVEDETGNLVVAGLAAPGALPAKLGYVTRTGAVLTSHVISSPADLNPTGIEIKESRKVSGFGLARAGSTYFVNFAFPASPGSSYVAAMSTGLRPGFPLGDGRVINLAVDLLFVLSVGGIPGITTGFTGVLDGTGRATGTITLPPGFPPGIRFYVSALVVNPAAPLGIDSGNSLGVTSN